MVTGYTLYVQPVSIAANCGDTVTWWDGESTLVRVYEGVDPGDYLRDVIYDGPSHWRRVSVWVVNDEMVILGEGERPF
jgi:hypothetical protein